MSLKHGELILILKSKKLALQRVPFLIFYDIPISYDHVN